MGGLEGGSGVSRAVEVAGEVGCVSDRCCFYSLPGIEVDQIVDGIL